jgi:hypothetical protein
MAKPKRGKKDSGKESSRYVETVCPSCGGRWVHSVLCPRCQRAFFLIRQMRSAVPLYKASTHSGELCLGRLSKHFNRSYAIVQL